MAAVPSPSEHVSGLACIAGGALSIAACVATGIATSGAVSDDLFRHPWSASAFVGVTLALAALHVLILIGLAGLVRSGVAGCSRAARVGGVLALAGTAVLFVAEFASLPVAGQDVDETGAELVGALFGLGSLLATVGLLSLGVATLRAGCWEDWRRFTPLACGICLLIVIPIQFTSLLWAGLIPYGCAFVALGVALTGSRQPAGVPATA
jgi:hypothetical protein